MTSEEMKSVWADHCRFEFELRDVDATLATMSDNPHMLNVPTDGVDPTGRQVRIPMLAVVGFRDGKVDYEHIWWDQASVLAQLGLLDTGRLPVLATRQADAIAALGDRGD